jgi:hypothetical protein
MAAELPKITFDASSQDAKRFLMRRNLLYGIGAIAGAIVTLLLLALWIWPSANGVQADLANAKKEFAVSTERTQVLSGISPEDKADFLRAAQTLPPSKEPLVVLQALTDIAQESGVLLSKYDTNPGLISTGSALANRGASATNRVQSLLVSVEMSGTFQQIRQALDLVESAAPIMEVTELSLSPTSREETDVSQATYKAILKVTTYFYPSAGVGTPGSGAKALKPDQSTTFDTIRTWRNRLPEGIVNPEVYSRTNLFQLEVPVPSTVVDEPVTDGSAEQSAEAAETDLSETSADTTTETSVETTQ